MFTFKLAYNFTHTKSAPRRVDIKADSMKGAIDKLTHQLWWDCISPSEVTINCVGKSPA